MYCHVLTYIDTIHGHVLTCCMYGHCIGMLHVLTCSHQQLPRCANKHTATHTHRPESEMIPMVPPSNVKIVLDALTSAGIKCAIKLHNCTVGRIVKTECWTYQHEMHVSRI